jgi:hypothetical protein
LCPIGGAPFSKNRTPEIRKKSYAKNRTIKNHNTASKIFREIYRCGDPYKNRRDLLRMLKPSFAFQEDTGLPSGSAAYG